MTDRHDDETLTEMLERMDREFGWDERIAALEARYQRIFRDLEVWELARRTAVRRRGWGYRF